MKKQTAVYVGIGLLIVIILCWDQIKAFAKGKKSGSTSGGRPASTIPGTTIPTGTSATGSISGSKSCLTGMINNSEPLKRGSCSATVGKLQELLNSGWSAGLVVDGNFGAKTEAALKSATNGKTSTTIATMLNLYGAKTLNYGQTTSSTNATDVDTSFWGWLTNWE